MAITSLLPVTQLTGQHAVLPRVTQLDDDEDLILAAGSDTK
jgi:hypothetical protein